MHNLYGNRKLSKKEIKGSFKLSNQMYCEWGVSDEEGIGVDIYDDKTKTLLVGLEHHLGTTSTPNAKRLKLLLESFLYELEDSMVYYYGPKECQFTEEELYHPIPAKTGRFAKQNT